MLDKKLISLGEDQCRDYRELMLGHIKNSFYTDYITADDLEHYNRTVSDAYKFIQIGLDFVENYMAANTGFPNLDWGLSDNERGPEPVKERMHFPTKTRLVDQFEHPQATAGKINSGLNENGFVQAKYTNQENMKQVQRQSRTSQSRTSQSRTSIVQPKKTSNSSSQRQGSAPWVRPENRRGCLVPESNSYNIIHNEIMNGRLESDQVMLDPDESHSLNNHSEGKMISESEVFEQKQIDPMVGSTVIAGDERSETLIDNNNAAEDPPFSQETFLSPGKELTHRPVMNLGDLASALNSGPAELNTEFDESNMLQEEVSYSPVMDDVATALISDSPELNAEFDERVLSQEESINQPPHFSVSSLYFDEEPLHHGPLVTKRFVKQEDIDENINAKHRRANSRSEFYGANERRVHLSASHQPILLADSLSPSPQANPSTEHQFVSADVESNEYYAMSTAQETADMDKIMDELTRRIQRDYKRFYRS